MILAHIGGEEFLVVTFSSKARSTHIIGECLRQEIEQVQIQHEDFIFNITASLGIAISPERYRFSSLMHQADLQLYKAKENGRNQVQSCTVDSPLSLLKEVDKLG